MSMDVENVTEGVVDAQGTRRPFRVGDCVMAKMGPEGDTKTIWDPNRPEEVDNARTTFENLRKKGYRAYRVNAQGDKGEPMDNFDTAAGKVIMVPPLQGG